MTLGRKPVALEPRWHTAGASLRDIVASVTAELREQEQQRGQRVRARKAQDAAKFERAVEVILCNFVAISMVDPERWLMVRLGNYASSASPIYGRHFNSVVDLMLDVGLVTKRVGYRIDRMSRAASCIRPTARLAECLRGIHDSSTLRLEEYDGFITLSAEDSFVQRPITPQVEAWLKSVEEEIAQINERLRQADIQGDPHGIVHLADIPGSIADYLITPHHRTVHRIFNGSYDLGGRLFGGWWETLARSKRFQLIRIKGERVLNVDYGQLFLRLAYASCKQSPPPGDLYDLTGTDHQRDDWKQLREGRKKLVNALIFNRKPLAQWPGKTAKERASLRDCFPPRTKLRDAAEAIRQRHHAIAAEWFGRGRGLGLMRQESDMLVAVLLRLMSIGVTALPLHDSVIVARKDAPLAKRAMEDVARMLIGTEIPVKIESGQDCG